jgi:methyl-accepting chemotaxis protein
VRRLLEDIQKSISVTVQMTERGAERVSTSVEQVRGFGDNMRQMSSIMKDSSLAVRQISAAVHQQAQGISQIFQAVNDLNSTMDETLKQLGDLSNLTRDVGEVSTEVNALINRHGWEHVAAVPASPAPSEAK